MTYEPVACGCLEQLMCEAAAAAAAAPAYSNSRMEENEECSVELVNDFSMKTERCALLREHLILIISIKRL